MGSQTMVAETAYAYYDTAVGYRALHDLDRAYGSTAIGSGALEKTQRGSYCGAVGYLALNSHSNPSTQLAIGSSVLKDLTRGYSNQGIGAFALSSCTRSGNMAVGASALTNNPPGYYNTALGLKALYSNSTGRYSVALGAHALQAHTYAYYSVAIGHKALDALTGSSYYNVAIGKSALENNTSGSYNVAIGHSAGLNATGRQNVFIGYQAGMNETGHRKLYIENSSSSTPLIYGEFDRDLITVNGNLGIKTKTFGTGASGVLAIANGTVPASSPTDQVQLYAADVPTGMFTPPSSELFVRDESGNVTTLSPHNFSLIPEGPSEPLAWSFCSERGDAAINVDMLKAVRLVEELSGEPLVHLKTVPPPTQKTALNMALAETKLKALKAKQHHLRHRLNTQEEEIRLLRQRLTRLQGALP